MTGESGRTPQRAFFEVQSQMLCFAPAVLALFSDPPHIFYPSDSAPTSATNFSAKEAKFQPYSPLSHISLDAFPLAQVRKLLDLVLLIIFEASIGCDMMSI